MNVPKVLKGADNEVKGDFYAGGLYVEIRMPGGGAATEMTDYHADTGKIYTLTNIFKALAKTGKTRVCIPINFGTGFS